VLDRNDVGVALSAVVDEKLVELFPEALAAQAKAILRVEQGDRVLLAVLTLSEGNLERLKHFSDAADADFRDVLYWAENPPTDDEPRSYEELRERLGLPADGFGGYARLFPRQTGTRDCQVRAGPAGNVFAGSCSTRVDLGDDGSARVIFKQSIQGNHWWLVRVSHGRARLIRDWGAPLVEGIA